MLPCTNMICQPAQGALSEHPEGESGGSGRPRGQNQISITINQQWRDSSQSKGEARRPWIFCHGGDLLSISCLGECCIEEQKPLRAIHSQTLLHTAKRVSITKFACHKNTHTLTQRHTCPRAHFPLCINS